MTNMTLLLVNKHCLRYAGPDQGAHQRPALCRAGGLQADEEEGEGNVPPPAPSGHLVPTGEFSLKGQLSEERDNERVKEMLRRVSTEKKERFKKVSLHLSHLFQLTFNQ